MDFQNARAYLHLQLRIGLDAGIRSWFRRCSWPPKAHSMSRTPPNMSERPSSAVPQPSAQTSLRLLVRSGFADMGLRTLQTSRECSSPCPVGMAIIIQTSCLASLDIALRTHPHANTALIFRLACSKITLQTVYGSWKVSSLPILLSAQVVGTRAANTTRTSCFNSKKCSRRSLPLTRISS
jgi:hypothetical protein